MDARLRRRRGRKGLASIAIIMNLLSVADE
jgi:hypothetical protein